MDLEYRKAIEEGDCKAMEKDHRTGMEEKNSR